MDKAKELHFLEIDDARFEIKDKYKKTRFQYEYLKEYQLAIQTWQEFLHEDQIIEIYQHMAVFAKNKLQPIAMSISNLQNYDGSFHLSNEWMANFYIPKAVQFGYRYMFFVKSKDFFANLALEDAVEELSQVKDLSEINIFDSLEEAMVYSKEIANTLLKKST